MGLPVTLVTCVGEMFAGANLALSLCPLLTQGQIEALEHHAADGGEGALPAEAGRRRLDRHDEPDRAAGRLRRRRGADPRRAAAATAPTRSAGRRSSSPGATTTWPRTSATWCWRGCRTAAPGTRGISLFLVPKFLPDAEGRPGVRERRAGDLARAQDGPARQPDLRHGVRRRHGLADRRAAPGHGGDVHHDEQRPARRRACRGCRRPRRRCRRRSAFARERRQGRDAGRRRAGDHRPRRRAADAGDHGGDGGDGARDLPRLRALDRHGASRPARRTGRRARRS